jgi:hypothetical protein
MKYRQKKCILFLFCQLFYDNITGTEPEFVNKIIKIYLNIYLKLTFLRDFTFEFFNIKINVTKLFSNSSHFYI